jgi:hypothetical protein
MNKTPFLRRLHSVAPRRNGAVKSDKPRNASERLAQRRGARCKPISFYDYRMGGVIHALHYRLSQFAAWNQPGSGQGYEQCKRDAARMSQRLNRAAWASRMRARKPRPAHYEVWARRRAGWRAAPALIPSAHRASFPRYGAFYLRLMRADAAPMRQA